MKRAPATISVFLAAAVETLTLIGALPPAEPGVRVAGVLGLGFKTSSPDRLVVDSSRHRGYYLTSSSVSVLDLRRLRVLTRKNMTVPRGPVAVDTIRHEVYVAPRAGSRCDTAAVWVLDGNTLTSKWLPLPCDPARPPVVVESMSFDAPQRVLSIAGHRNGATVFSEMPVRDDRIVPGWEIEQNGLCDSGALILRMKHGTAAHCSRGTQGRAIWIPTWHDAPVPDAIGRAIVRVTTTSEDAHASAVDPGTGRVALASADDSVALYDIPDEHRVATLLPEPDVAAARRTRANGSAFDSESGRLYLVRDGLVDVADVRANAPARTVRFEVPVGLRAAGRFSVDTGLHRFFVPTARGLVAMQDDRPQLPMGGDATPAAADVHDSSVASHAGEDAGAQLLVATASSGRAPAISAPAQPLERVHAAIEVARHPRVTFRITERASAVRSAVEMRRCRTCAPLRAPPSAI